MTLRRKSLDDDGSWAPRLETKLMQSAHNASRTVHLYLPDALADWETGYVTAYLNTPAYQVGDVRWRVQTVALDAKPVQSMGGLTIVPDMTLDALESSESAMLVLPGGTSWDKEQNGGAVEKARAFLDAGVPVAAICGATAGLARGGLLDDRRHTSNAPEYLQATGYKGVALYQHDRAVTDGNLITAGATGALEFARHIFARLALYPPALLEAWYQLFRTGEARYYFAMMDAMPTAATLATDE